MRHTLGLAVLMTAMLAACGGDGGSTGSVTAAAGSRRSTASAAPTTPGSGCPRTAGGRSAKGVAISLGSGPAYPVLGMAAAPPSPRGVASLTDDTHRQGVFLHK